MPTYSKTETAQNVVTHTDQGVVQPAEYAKNHSASVSINND